MRSDGNAWAPEGSVGYERRPGLPLETPGMPNEDVGMLGAFGLLTKNVALAYGMSGAC